MKLIGNLIFGAGMVLCLFFTAPKAFAQRGWELGGWLGTAYYFGDLNTSYYLGTPNLGGGLIGRFNFNSRVCLKMGANYGVVSASDANSKNPFERARNLSFQSQIYDGSMQIEINFLNYVHGSRSEFFTPYLFGGFSAFSYNPTAELNGQRYFLREMGTEGQFQGDEYYSISGAFVYGGGLKFDISRTWSINLEATARAAFTDYIDDVSTVYPDKKDLLRTRGPVAVSLSDRSIPIDGVDGSQLGRKGTQRGNSNNRDNLVFLQIGIVRYFGNLNCPRP